MNIVMTGGGRLIEIQATAEREPFERGVARRARVTLARKGVDEIAEAQRHAVGPA